MTVSTAKDIAEVVPGIWKEAVALRTAWINRNGFLHAIDFETRLNLDLIAAIKKGGLSGKNKVASPAFAKLVNSFECTATLTLLAGTDRRNYRRLKKYLIKYWKWDEGDLESEDEDDNKEKEPVSKPEDVFAALSFAVRKIEALKRISRIAAAKADFLKSFRLETRLNNINKALCTIRNCLKEVIPKVEK